MEEYLVVIPFLSSGAQGNELEYAVKGWLKHFKENFKIVIVGDYNSVCEWDNVVYINCPRVNDIKGQYRPHLDFVSKFKKVHETFPESKGFIFVADDCYAVNDFDIHDIMFLKMLESDVKFDSNSKNMFAQDKIKTKKVLLQKNLPTRNFTTHLPQYFEWDLLESLWNEYKMDTNSYVIEDLYYNTYYPNRVPFKIHHSTNNLKFGIYTRIINENELKNAFKERIWINNSPIGWTPILRELLKEHYK